MNRKLYDFVRRLVAPIKQKVMLTIGRAILTLVNDSTKVQSVQITLFADEVKDDVERFQEYGFTSVPITGAEGACVFVGGNRDHGIVVATDDRRFRPTGLKPGEVALYTAEGDTIIMKNGKLIETNTARSKLAATTSAETETISWKAKGSGIAQLLSDNYVNVEAPAVDVGTGLLEPPLNGATFQAWFNGHTHNIFGVPTTVPNMPSIPTHLSSHVRLGT